MLISMKQKILELRAQGLSYTQIKKVLGCSKGTIAYHLNDTTKFKTLQTTSEARKQNSLLTKVDKFKHKRKRNKLNEQTRDFQRCKRGGEKDRTTTDFSSSDVLALVGDSPKCYLTGRSIDLTKPGSFHFDHIIPATRGGTNSIDNLGLAIREANLAKGTLLLDEFVELCKEVLTAQGYIILSRDAR
jgi:5-methylcytosine-specific restriction endonuclease McrA